VGESTFPWDAELKNAIESLYYPRIFLLPTGHMFCATPLVREDDGPPEELTAFCIRPGMRQRDRAERNFRSRMMERPVLRYSYHCGHKRVMQQVFWSTAGRRHRS
jgi:hypothetical protein